MRYLNLRTIVVLIVLFWAAVVLIVVALAGCGGDTQRDITTNTTQQTITVDRSSGSPKISVASMEQADEWCSGWQGQGEWPFPKDDAVYLIGPNGDTLDTCAAP